MIEIFVKDIPEKFQIENTQLNITMVKELLNTMRSYNMLTMHKQKAYFDERTFIKLWGVFSDGLKIFDPNYNRQEDFRTYFDYLVRAIYFKEKINFFALFCPGYTRFGYKDCLGETTKWKLAKLFELKQYLDKNCISNEIKCFYSDVFLENTDSHKEPNWECQLEHNKQLFHIEGEKYFNKNQICNASDLPIFHGVKCVKGFIDKNQVKQVNPRTYSSFKKANEKFYKKLEFSEQEMLIRNDRLITMYRILSNYLNSFQNQVFLPMENMYERENIFSENGTCTMYFILRGGVNG